MKLKLVSDGREMYSGNLPADTLYFMKEILGVGKRRSRHFSLGFPGVEGELTIEAREIEDVYGIDRGELVIRGPLKLRYRYSNPKVRGKQESTICLDAIASLPEFEYNIEHALIKSNEGMATISVDTNKGPPYAVNKGIALHASAGLVGNIKASASVNGTVKSPENLSIAYDFSSEQASLMSIFSNMVGTVTVAGERDYTKKLRDVFYTADPDIVSQLEREMEIDNAGYKNIEMEFSVDWLGDIAVTW